jgi:PAS domain S-box-containing protein
VAASSTTHELVQRMLDQIHQNYSQRLTLSTLAKRLERQSAYLGKLFRDEIGVTVHEYITRARMMFGAAQVRSGVKIEAVALDLGYRSKKNFYRQFKRRFGMTPEAYRYHQSKVAGDDSRAPASRQTRTDPAIAADCPASADDLPSHGHRGLNANAPAWPTSRAQEILLRTIVGSQVAMLVTDSNGCYVAANQGAVSITGYSVDELRGMPAKTLLPTPADSDTRCRLQLIFPRSSALSCNAVLRTRSARAVPVHLTSVENILSGTAKINAEPARS